MFQYCDFCYILFAYDVSMMLTLDVSALSYVGLSNEKPISAKENYLNDSLYRLYEINTTNTNCYLQSK